MLQIAIATRPRLRECFTEWDVLLAPANLVVAFPHTGADEDGRALDVNGERIPYGAQAFYPGLGNLSGHPSTAFPAGLTVAGLPIGLQAIGPYLEDRTPIRFATLVAQVFGGYRPPPGYEPT